MSWAVSDFVVTNDSFIEVSKIVRVEIEEFASSHVDRQENPFGEYHGNFTFHTNVEPFESYEDALHFLTDFGRGRDGAVRFRNVEGFSNAKLKKLRERLRSERRKLTEYDDNHSIYSDGRKSNSISCPNCKKRFTLKYYRSNRCSNCGCDLRSKTVLERLSKYRSNIRLLDEAIEKEQAEHLDKMPISWSVYLSVHC